MNINQGLLTQIERKALFITILVGLSFLLIANPAVAHHAFGGETPSNVFEGFLSGLAHPIIGADHFAFVVAVGLLAALKARGLGIPVVFILAAVAGTGLHLMSIDLPLPELFISASVLIWGIMLAMKDSPNLATLLGLAAVAGIFHGYAYGEAIVGAEMTPLVAYLTGFTVVQLGVALLAFGSGKWVLKRCADPLYLRFAGFTICGAGVAFLSSVVLG